MKTLLLKMLSLFFLMAGGIAAVGQDRQDVPGDYFSLEGALELFKKSQSPEEFERLLNSADSKVNNLDLNGDGEIDYIRVIDRNEGNVHAFILQAVLSRNESQDVAVIELEKLANGKAVLQITGDEDVYGIETIIEPTEEVRVNAGYSTSRVVVNVWAWPSVQYVYSPYYEVWVSPWHWHYRPVWWISWRPIAYYDYYSYWYPYRTYYSPCHTHRIVYAQQIYRPHRTCSSVYYDRHRTQIVKVREHHGRGNHYGYGKDKHVDRGNHYAYDKRNHYTDLNGRERDEAGKFSRDNNSRTPIVKEKTNYVERRNDTFTGYSRSQERKPNMDRTSSVKRDEHTFVSRSDSWSKPNISERKSYEQPRSFDRSPGRQQHVTPSNHGSQQREFKSVERSGGKGHSSGGSSSGGGHGKSSGRGHRKG